MLMVKSFVLTALLFAGGVAHAAVILQVDVSDPMAVVFTSTAAFADNTVLNADSLDGIALLSFFSGNVGTLDTSLDSGAINVFDSTAGTTRQPLDRIFVDTFSGITPLDLNFYELSSGSGFDMSFLDTETALTGLASHDLSALTGLPTLGTLGDVFAGGLASSNIIGQWNVVPEPSTAALMTLGLIGLASRRRRS
jgi:hypothetical protein